MKKSEKKLLKKWKKLLKKGERIEFKSIYERMIYSFFMQEGVLKHKKIGKYFIASHCDEIMDEL